MNVELIKYELKKSDNVQFLLFKLNTLVTIMYFNIIEIDIADQNVVYKCLYDYSFCELDH